jgi:hypothetical protein
VDTTLMIESRFRGLAEYAAEMSNRVWRPGEWPTIAWRNAAERLAAVARSLSWWSPVLGWNLVRVPRRWADAITLAEHHLVRAELDVEAGRLEAGPLRSHSALRRRRESQGQPRVARRVYPGPRRPARARRDARGGPRLVSEGP